MSELDHTAGIVRVSWAPLRREPRHASEMVNQVLLGEAVTIDGRDPAPGWLAVRAPDGYPGFVTVGSLATCSGPAASDWAARASATSLGSPLVPARAAGKPVAAGPFTSHAPWGARLVVAADGRIELPTGDLAEAAAPDRIVTTDRAIRFPRDRAAVPRTAESWLGTPYLWGGRTEQGADCSGLVQAVFAMHGFSLPRDSRDQFEARSGSHRDPGEGAPGDVWFFAWDGKPVSHVGICLGGGKLLHASETRGRVAVNELGGGDFGRRLAEGLVGVLRPED